MRARDCEVCCGAFLARGFVDGSNAFGKGEDGLRLKLESNLGIGGELGDEVEGF
jgi:hypothetical protein